MKTVFADAFYFLALLNPADQAHGKALGFTSSNTVAMVTTEWVLTELADALARSRRGRSEFLSTLADLRADGDVTIVLCEHSLLEEGIQLFAARPDKDWSLTDCTSFVVMTRRASWIHGTVEVMIASCHEPFLCKTMTS
jgi:predicted nucleic acid-binding protein